MIGGVYSSGKEVAKQQQHGFGAMITFYCIGSKRGEHQAAVAVVVLKNKVVSMHNNYEDSLLFIYHGSTIRLYS